LGEIPDERTPAPTTRLGNWYATVLATRPAHLALCISENSLLPIIVPLKHLALFPDRLAENLRLVLVQLGVAPSAARREGRHMWECYFRGASSFRVLGSLRDFVINGRAELKHSPGIGCVELSLELAETPCGPLGMRTPHDVTVARLRQRRA
jgi:hypothetical protein